jgi:hypothetical protein
VNFAAITLCVASQQVFIIVIVVVYFIIDSVRKLLGTPSYTSEYPPFALTIDQHLPIPIAAHYFSFNASSLCLSRFITTGLVCDSLQSTDHSLWSFSEL